MGFPNFLLEFAVVATVASVCSAQPRGRLLKDNALVPDPPSPGDISGLACKLGGTSCEDYDDYFEFCNDFSCNRDLRICESSPKEVGTPCELSNDPGDYDFNACTVGASTCHLVTRPDGRVTGKCLGDPNPGVTCDDRNTCTDNDTCVLDASMGDNIAVCRGTFVEGTCDDYNSCTDGDVCVRSDGGGAKCEGTDIPEGSECEGENKCYEEFECERGDNGGLTCVANRNSARFGMPCDDYNSCTGDGICRRVQGSESVECMVGTFDASRSCSDGDECTSNDVCVVGESPEDGPACVGTPIPGCGSDSSPGAV